MDRVMRDPPYRFERSRIVRQTRDDVPVDVGELIAEELVVDLLGIIDLRECLGDGGHILHQLNPFRRSQVEEFRCVALENNDSPPAKELIVVEVGFREAEIRNEMIGSRPGTCAGLARRVGHVRMCDGHYLISRPSTAPTFNDATGRSIAKLQCASEWRGARRGDCLDTSFHPTIFCLSVHMMRRGGRQSAFIKGVSRIRSVSRLFL